MHGLGKMRIVKRDFASILFGMVNGKTKGNLSQSVR